MIKDRNRLLINILRLLGSVNPHLIQLIINLEDDTAKAFGQVLCFGISMRKKGKISEMNQCFLKFGDPLFGPDWANALWRGEMEKENEKFLINISYLMDELENKNSLLFKRFTNLFSGLFYRHLGFQTTIL